jgi:hypothetical protein
MTLIIQKPTGAKLNLAQTYVGIDDPDAAVYVAAVEAADEAASPGVGALETATKVAIHSFVKGCKADGIWPAIKASCILAGARTLTGALVPLVGTAPTNVGPFVSGDYNRETGLVGDGSTKYLNSNRNNNADPQDNRHLSVYVSTAPTGAFGTHIGALAATGSSFMYKTNTNNINISISSTGENNIGSTTTGFIAASRNLSASYTARIATASAAVDRASATPNSILFNLFRMNRTSGDFLWSNGRLAFYSIGESLDLALLDTRVTTLINAFAAAIP